uniref:DUF4005 domain-containing protein n=1 Tax=Elaeophora elaphi TaxID=1147741 RepID=A0A0R3RT35_9BILA
MSEDSPKITRNDNSRKTRPTMQLYCPRILRTGAAGKRTDGREKNAKNQQLVKSVNAVKDYANLNHYVGNRQRNNKESPNNSTYKVEMNSSESLRKSSNSINKSCDHLAESSDPPKRRPGRRMYSSSNNCYSSSQSLCEGCSTNNDVHYYNGPASSRFGTKISSWNQKEAFSSNSTSPSVSIC